MALELLKLVDQFLVLILIVILNMPFLLSQFFVTVDSFASSLHRCFVFKLDDLIKGEVIDR